MKYATWEVTNGTTPEAAIQAKGGQAQGALSLTFNTILAYVSDNADLTGLSEWNVQPQTSAQALALAKSVAPSAYYSASNQFVCPIEYTQIV